MNTLKGIFIRKNIVIALGLALVMTVMSAFTPDTAFAASTDTSKASASINEATDTVNSKDITYLVNESGTLAPGERKSGTFELTNIFSNSFTVRGGVTKNSAGSVTFIIESAQWTLQPSGTVSTICTESGWSRGTYRYTIVNNSTTGYSGYVFSIYK